MLLADHGESLGEHGENTHTFFVYDATQHVPLVVRTPWGDRGRSRAQVSTVDLMPTVLDLVGLAPQPGIDGRSLARLVLDPAAESPGVAYSETYFPRFHFGWQHLRSMRDGQWKYIEAPTPGALRRAAGPGRDEERLQGLLAPRGGPPPPARRDGGQRRAGRAGRDDPRPRDAAAARRPRLRGRRPPGRPRGGAPRPEGQDRPLREDGRRAGPREGGQARGGGRRDARGDRRGPRDHRRLHGPRGLAAQAQAAGGGDRRLPPHARDRPAERDGARRPRRGLPRAGQAGRRDRRLPHRAEARAAAAADVVPARDALPGPRARGGGPPDLRGGARSTTRRWAPPTTAWPRSPSSGATSRRRSASCAGGWSSRRTCARAASTWAASWRPAATSPAPRSSTARSSQQFADNGRARFNLAQLARQRGDRAGFLAELRESTEKAPEFGPAFFFLAREELQAGRLDAAADLARKGLEVDKGSQVAPLGHYVLADVYNRRGKTAEAADEVAKARRIESARRRSSAAGA